MFLVDLSNQFMYIFQGCFTGTGAILYSTSEVTLKDMVKTGQSPVNNKT